MSTKLSANFGTSQLETIRKVQVECGYATLAAALRAIVDRYARAPIVAEIRLPRDIDKEGVRIVLRQILPQVEIQYKPKADWEICDGE